VVHCACPNPSKAPKDEKLVMRPAIEGTQTVLRASQAAKVKRVVITSSIATIFMRGEATHQADYDEKDWSEQEMCLNIHHKINYHQEVAVLNFINENNRSAEPHKVQATTLILGMCLGPTLVTHEFTAGILIEQFLMGKVPGVAKMMFPMVDIRDAGIAHIKALESEGAANQRIIVAGANIWFKDMA
jgi:dihydroflavonol-4-reductase